MEAHPTFSHLQVGTHSPQFLMAPISPGGQDLSAHPSPGPTHLWEGHCSLPNAHDCLCPQFFIPCLEHLRTFQNIPRNPSLAWNVVYPSFWPVQEACTALGFHLALPSFSVVCESLASRVRSLKTVKGSCAPLAPIFLAQGWAAAQYQPAPAACPLCGVQLAWSRDQGPRVPHLQFSS